MAPTSDERREIAAWLLIEVKDEDTSLDYPVHRIINDVLGVNGAWGAKAAHILADLIDPTCHEVGSWCESGLYYPTIYHHELSCGHTITTPYGALPECCDECGARILDYGERED